MICYNHIGVSEIPEGDSSMSEHMPMRRTLAVLREEAGLSQAELAKRLTYTASRVSRIFELNGLL